MLQIRCPGCSLEMPENKRLGYDGYYNCSKECWAVYSEVLGYQFSNAIVFSQVHQLTVDAYAIQHAGGSHPDKSIAIHLCGLHAAYNLRISQIEIPKLLQKVSKRVQQSDTLKWPHLEAKQYSLATSIFDIAVADTAQGHVDRAKEWAELNWLKWSEFHDSIAQFVESLLD